MIRIAIFYHCVNDVNIGDTCNNKVLNYNTAYSEINIYGNTNDYSILKNVNITL